MPSLRPTVGRDNEGPVSPVRRENAHLPRPVVKWAGGKGKLAERLVAWMPERIGTYAEPFFGGGAVFFRLACDEPRRFEHAVLADKNEHLVALYRAIQTDVDDLVTELGKLARAHLALAPDAREAHFYAVREREPKKADLVRRGARLLFLNKTCFNGLWRVNASGKNNVPFGRYKAPKILDESALRAAHVALARASIELADFAEVTRRLGPGDFAYFDPPYVPVSKTANFTAYAKDGFGPEDQARLCEIFRDLGRRDVSAMLSNARTAETEALYEEFERTPVPMRRSINSRPDRRGDVEELVVWNRPAPAGAPRARRAAS